MRVFRRAGRSSSTEPAGQPREILGGALQRGEGDAPRLVGQRHLDVGAAGERLEQAPLGAGQILEAVREDGLAVPRVELRGEPLHRPAPDDVAVPEPEAVELGPVGGVERREIAVQVAGLDQPRLEVGERLPERVGEPRLRAER